MHTLCMVNTASDETVTNCSMCDAGAVNLARRGSGEGTRRWSLLFLQCAADLAAFSVL